MSEEIKSGPPMQVMLGRRIASLRALHGMGQDDLAKAIGVTQGTVSRWETGAKEPRLRTLIAVAQAFGCTVEYLMSGPEATSPLGRADAMAKESAHAA
ncbi:MAG TPA: helix-turn-helix transcriptional regulator [Gemmatimonadaceae bacterium]|nr:helix-turn-helix transcriptional regulator [Gemmatimonadaceae bacterium]